MPGMSKHTWPAHLVVQTIISEDYIDARFNGYIELAI